MERTSLRNRDRHCAPAVWGAVIGALGLVTLVGSFTALFAVRNVGVYGSAVWLCLLGIAMLIAASYDPRVSISGAVLDFTMALSLYLVARAREVRPNAGLPPRR